MRAAEAEEARQQRVNEATRGDIKVPIFKPAEKPETDKKAVALFAEMPPSIAIMAQPSAGAVAPEDKFVPRHQRQEEQVLEVRYTAVPTPVRTPVSVSVPAAVPAPATLKQPAAAVPSPSLKPV
jgi:hypothetical protein